MTYIMSAFKLTIPAAKDLTLASRSASTSMRFQIFHLKTHCNPYRDSKNARKRFENAAIAIKRIKLLITFIEINIL